MMNKEKATICLKSQTLLDFKSNDTMEPNTVVT